MLKLLKNYDSIYWDLDIHTNVCLNEIIFVCWSIYISDDIEPQMTSLEYVDWDLSIYVDTELDSLNVIGGKLNHYNGEFKANKLTKVDWKAYIPSND
jgi:hypothetical protein